MKNDLESLEAWTREISRCWPMDKGNYPNLDGLVIEYLRHVALHVNKDSGRIATAIEPHDHDRPVDFQLLERATRNLLVNALMLCDLMGWRASSLLAQYREEATKEQGRTTA